jgi:hypothetical protein
MKKCKFCSSDRVVKMLIYESPDNGDMSEYKGKRFDVTELFGGPETVEMSFCAECGKIQRKFPIPEKKLLGCCYDIEDEEEPEEWSEENLAKREKEMGI